MSRSGRTVFFLFLWTAIAGWGWILLTVSPESLQKAAVHAWGEVPDSAMSWTMTESIRAGFAQAGESWVQAVAWLADRSINGNWFSLLAGDWVLERFLAAEHIVQIWAARFLAWQPYLLLTALFWLACLVDGWTTRLRSLRSFAAPLPALSWSAALGALISPIAALAVALLPFSWAGLIAAAILGMGGLAAGLWLTHFHRFG